MRVLVFFCETQARLAQILRTILMLRMQEMAFPGFKFQKFDGRILWLDPPLIHTKKTSKQSISKENNCKREYRFPFYSHSLVPGRAEGALERLADFRIFYMTDNLCMYILKARFKRRILHAPNAIQTIDN